MKCLLPLLVLCFPFVFLNAQVQKLATHQTISSYQIDLEKDNLILNDYQTFPKGENKILKVESSLKNNELLINYELEHPGEQGYYVLRLEAIFEDQIIEARPGYLLGDFGTVSTDIQGEKQIIWTNFIADLPAAKGKLQLSLKVECWGLQYLAYDVDCNYYPTFGFKEKLPFYAGAVAGAGGVVTGILLRNNARRHLERHRMANTLSEQASEYQSYTNKLQSAEVVTYVGLGVIALDALLYFLRKEKHKKRIRVFEEFCGKSSLSFHFLEGLPTDNTQGTPTIHLSYQF